MRCFSHVQCCPHKCLCFQQIYCGHMLFNGDGHRQYSIEAVDAAEAMDRLWRFGLIHVHFLWNRSLGGKKTTKLSAWRLTFWRGIRCPGPGVGMMHIFKAKITQEQELTLCPTSLLNLAADCKQEFTRKPLSLPQASFVYSRTVGVKNVFTGPRQLSHTTCLPLQLCGDCFWQCIGRSSGCAWNCALLAL